MRFMNETEPFAEPAHAEWDDEGLLQAHPAIQGKGTNLDYFNAQQ